MDKIDKFIGEYSFLNNFYPVDITIDNITYHSAEAAFQAMRTSNIVQRKLFSHMLPGEAIRYGSKVTVRKDWDNIKIQEMEKILDIKFNNQLLHNKLLATNDLQLINGTDNDPCFGAKNNKGNNQLGKLLMSLREKLRDNNNILPQNDDNNIQNDDNLNTDDNDKQNENDLNNNDNIKDNIQNNDNINEKKKKKHKHQ